MKVHPAHFQHHSLSSITLQGRSLKFDADDVPVVVWSGQSCLRITPTLDEAGLFVDIDLTLADVKRDWASDMEQHVIIVSQGYGPQHQNVEFGDINYDVLMSRADVPAIGDDTVSIPRVSQGKDASDAAPEFWIFLVEGNTSCVRTILQQMGEVGAIRRDPFAVIEIGQKIGSGGTANVYCAKYCHAGGGNESGCTDTMAVKVLEPSPKCATALQELDAVRHEITLIVRAGTHPNIIRFLGLFCLEDQDESMSIDVGLMPRWALVSEYVAGGDLCHAVSKRRFKEPRAHQVIADLLCALAHIHRRGIVHRDVKPANLLLTKHGKAVLADFGLAALTSDAEAMCQSCGTPGYVAPEVISRKQSGVKVDSFSTGATLYFMLCGKLPFEGSSTISTLERTMKDEVSFNSHPEFSEVGWRCKYFIHKLLQKDPRNRPTAGQAASQMWGSTEYLECGRDTWKSNAVHCLCSGGMSEARVHDKFVAYFDPHASSSCIPSDEREAAPAEEENADSTSDMEKGKREQSRSRICGEEEDFHHETPNNSSVQTPPKTYRGPNPETRRGHVGRLLQALRSSNAAKLAHTRNGTQGDELGFNSVLPVLPAAPRPEHPRPQPRSFKGWLFRRRNRKEDH